MKKKYFVIVALVLAAAVIFFPDFSFAGEDRIDIGSVTNNSVLIGMDVFQLGNTASFTRDNVFAALETGSEMYFKFGGVWHNLNEVNSVYDLLDKKYTVDVADKPLRRWFRAGTEVSYFTSYVEAALEAVNSSEESLQLCQRVISDAELFGISEEAMGLFNSMGSYQAAVGEAILAERQVFGSLGLAEVKDSFEFYVRKEYDKKSFIDALNHAEDVAVMETVLMEYIPVLQANRQALIARGAVGSGESYTLILNELGDNLDTEYVSLLAAELLAVRGAGSFTCVNAVVESLGVEFAQLLINSLPEFEELIFQDRDLVEGARRIIDALGSEQQGLVENLEKLLGLEDKMAALDTIYHATIDFSNTINNQAPRTDPPNKLLVELDAENMAMTFIFSPEAQNMGPYTALQATGLKAAFYNLAAIPEIQGVSAGGSTVNFKNADGTPRSGQWFEIDLAFFGFALVGNPTWVSEIIGQSQVMTMNCVTADGVPFTLEITFSFIGS